MLPGPATKTALLGCLLLPAVALGAGCVTIFEPLSGSRRPVVVDPQLANFEGLRLTVHCVPQGFQHRGRARALCRKVGTLFRNQGAEVHTVTTLSRAGDPEDDTAEESGAPPPTDLILTLRGRLLHKENNELSWLLCFVTGTLAPSFTEYTFEQDVVVTDASGFLLVSESLKGRFDRWFGLGVWGGNKLLDLVVRDESEELTGNKVSERYSEHFYGQISQLVLNARLLWQAQRPPG